MFEISLTFAIVTELDDWYNCNFWAEAIDSRPASVVSTHLPSSGFQSAQGSPASVQMVLDPLISPQGNTYVDGVPTDNLMRELDRRADLVYAEVIEERNQEEMARYANSGLESD